MVRLRRTSVWWVCAVLCGRAWAAVVGNIDATPAVERVGVTQEGALLAADAEGVALAGWPRQLWSDGRRFVGEPRLLDVDADGQREILIVSRTESGAQQLHAFKGSGVELPAWRFALGTTPVVATPLVADLNQDGHLDIAYAMSNREVRVVTRSTGTATPYFAATLAATPYLLSGDLDNDGLTNLYAAAGNTVWAWDSVGVRRALATLPADEDVIGAPAIADLDRDNRAELLWTTTQQRIVGAHDDGSVAVDLTLADDITPIAPLVIDDIDADTVPDFLVLTAQQQIVALAHNGAVVEQWSVPADYRQSGITAGVVAHDAYRGGFASRTGWDQWSVYRTASHQFSRLILGETVREWDAAAHFDFLDPIDVGDLFTTAMPFSPNGDGVNDIATIHYRLSAPALVALDLYDAQGRYIGRIKEKVARAAGEQTETWNGVDTHGTRTPRDDTPLPTGLYDIRVVAESADGLVTQSTVSAIVNGIAAAIETPRAQATVFGAATMLGTAVDPNFGEGELDADFASYKLYSRPGVWTMTDDDILAVGAADSAWRPLLVPLRHQCIDAAQLEPNDTAYPASNVSCRPIQHGVLGLFDTTDVVQTPNGDYTLLLKVTDSHGNTHGKMQYATRVVTVANRVEGEPFDAADPLDPNHPDNPRYIGPKIFDVSATNAFLTRQSPQTEIRYRLAHETANVQLTIYADTQGVGSPVAALYSFAAQAPNDDGMPYYALLWNGTNTLGRPVSGGTYRVQITAYGVDGTGVDVSDTLEISVGHGFAASDSLALEALPDAGGALLTATPSHFNPLGFGGDLTAESTTIRYRLTREARVTLQVLDDVAGQGLVVRKTLLADAIRQFDGGGVVWDGSGDNGLLLPVDREYRVRFTATSIDAGNDVTLMQDVLVHLDATERNTAIAADIQQLRGDAGEQAWDDAPIAALQGNPDFLWRAAGVGNVVMPFTYTIGVQGTETRRGPLQTVTTTEPVIVCLYNTVEVGGGGGFGGGGGGDLPPGFSYYPHRLVSAELAAGATLTRWMATASLPSTMAQDLSINPPGSPVALDPLYEQTPGEGGQLVNPARAEFDIYGSIPLNPPDQFAAQCELHIPPLFPPGANPDPVWQQYCSRCGPTACSLDNGFTIVGLCGTVTVLAEGRTQHTATWGPFAVSGAASLTSTGVNPVADVAHYTGPLGSGAPDMVADSAVITQRSLTIQNTVNGVPSTQSSNGGDIVLPGLRARLNDTSLFASIESDGALVTTFATDQHDPFAATAPYKKIWGVIDDFNDDTYRRDTHSVNFFTDGYQAHIFNQAVGTTLYSFSDVVHLNAWTLDVRYPNISTQRPDGDNLLDTGDGHRDIFHLESVQVTPPGVRDARNSNIDDTFRLRLRPDAVPRRFIEIRGSAAAQYELYYYDHTEDAPRWYAIAPRTANPVANDILAHWDVTDLNGAQYTIVLKSPQNGAVNLDTMDIAIGTWVDTQTLGADDVVRVFSTFKKASLIFGAGSVANSPQLVTITPVKPSDADFTLPSGIAPLGPIFSIKPDTIAIDPLHHVQLALVLTPDELTQVFGVANASEVTIYNLTGDDTIEGLATVATFDDHDDDDPTNDVWRFSAALEHFSQYFLARRTAGFVQRLTPPRDSTVHGAITLAGRVETTPRPPAAPEMAQPLAALTALTIRARAADGSAPELTLFAQTSAEPSTALAEFAVPWDVGALNGAYRVFITAQGPGGATTTSEWPVAIDNAPAQTTLLLGGTAVAPGATVHAAPGVVWELLATDHASETWQTGVAAIEYRFDDDAFRPYEQPMNLALTPGAHRIAYRSTDHLGNQEAERSATIVLADDAPSDAPADALTVQVQFSGPTYATQQRLWVGPQTTMQLSAASPDVAVKYRVATAEFEPYHAAVPLRFSGEGEYTVEAFALDPRGLRGPLQHATIVYDRTPPVTVVTLLGAHRALGDIWNVAPDATVQLGAYDQGEIPAGLDRIEYRIGDGVWQHYQSPFALPGDGTYDIRAIDRVGNSEIPQRLTIHRDAAAPTGTAIVAGTQLSPNGDGRFDTLPVTLHVADDVYADAVIRMTLLDAAGIERVVADGVRISSDATTHAWDGRIDGAPTPEGRYTCVITARDDAGNARELYRGPLTIDVTPPHIAIRDSTRQAFSPNGDDVLDILSVEYDADDNLQDDVLVRLAIDTLENQPLLATETTTHLADPGPYAIAWNGANAASIDVFDDTYRVTLTAEDPAGNRSAVQSASVVTTGTVLVDRLAPLTRLTVNGPQYDDGATLWLGGDATLQLGAVDPPVGSGVQTIRYGFDGMPTLEYRTPIALASDGMTQTFRYHAVDLLGNLESVQSQPVRRDTLAPVSTLTIGAPHEAAAARVAIAPSTVLTLAADDDGGVGVAARWLEIVGARQATSYAEPLTLAGLGDGPYDLHTWAEDWLGNIEPTHTQAVWLDATAPVTTLHAEAPVRVAADVSATWYVRADTRLTCSAVGERDDVARTEYSIDKGPWQLAAPFHLTTEGRYAIAYRSIDRLGNIEPMRVQMVVVDNTPPVVSWALDQTAAGTTNNESSRIAMTPTSALTLTATDADAQVARIEYQWDAAAWQTYAAPLTLAGSAAGTHQLRFRAVDQLGTTSDVRTLAVDLLDVAVTRDAEQLPRVLVFMLQTRDLYRADEQPTTDLLATVQTALGGYWTVLDGDQNDPAMVDRFLEALRSDKYRTIIFATDAHAVTFFDSAKITHLLREIKTRIYKGDTFVSLLGGAQIAGEAWTQFWGDTTPRPDAPAMLFDGMTDRLDAAAWQYGRGVLLTVENDLGRMAAADAADAALVGGGLVDLLRTYIAAPDEPNQYEVRDYTLTYRNDADVAVTIDTTEQLPPGWIETAGTAGEVAVTTRDFALTIPPRGTTTVDYLYRARGTPGTASLTTHYAMTWENSLQSQHTDAIDVAVARDIPMLFSALIGVGGSLTDAVAPEAAALVRRAQARSQLAPGAGATAAEIDAVLTLLLDADAAVPLAVAQAHADLAELIEVIGAQQAFGALALDLSVSVGNPNDPASFHGDTTAYLSSSGGCALVAESP